MPLPALIARPYRAPRCAAGEYLYCEHHQDDVAVAGFTVAPIPWPAYRRPGAAEDQLTPILTGDLARAVRVESAAAVASWWGVSRATVGRWRRALGVGRMNEGTRARWVELAPRRLSPEARRKGGAARGRQQRATRKKSSQ